MKTETTMENPSLSKSTISFGVALALASVINGLLVVAKEKSPAVMTGLQKMSMHHWLSHAIIVVGLFVAFGWIINRPAIAASRLIRLLVSGVVLGGLIIVGFYLIEG